MLISCVVIENVCSEFSRDLPLPNTRLHLISSVHHLSTTAYVRHCFSQGTQLYFTMMMGFPLFLSWISKFFSFIYEFIHSRNYSFPKRLRIYLFLRFGCNLDVFPGASQSELCDSGLGPLLINRSPRCREGGPHTNRHNIYLSTRGRIQGQANTQAANYDGGTELIS